MKTEEQIEKRLFDMAGEFRAACYGKKWIIARRLYDKAITLCTELDMPEDVKKKLFGTRPYEADPADAKDGAFEEDLVIRMLEQCIRNEEERIEEEKKRKAYLQHKRFYAKK